MIRGTIQLTPDQLAEIVASALAQNGYECDGLGIYLDGHLVEYDSAVATLSLREIKVRAAPEESEILRQLYPPIKTELNDNGGASPRPVDGSGAAGG